MTPNNGASAARVLVRPRYTDPKHKIPEGQVMVWTADQLTDVTGSTYIRIPGEVWSQSYGIPEHEPHPRNSRR